MTTSRIFSSIDAGAPQLRSVIPGDMIAIFTACLVNGYGTTEPLGWTMPFYDAGKNTAAYRNNIYTGSGCLLRVEDNIYPNGNSYYMNMYASMSSIDFGVDRIPATGASSNMKGGSNQYVPDIKWYLIGDDRGFYFISFPYAYDTTVYDLAYIVYAGDVVPLIPSANKIYGLFGNSNTNGWFGVTIEDIASPTLIYNPTYNFSWISRNPVSNDAGIIPAKLLHNFRLISSVVNNQNFGASTGEIPPVNSVPYSVDNTVVIQGATAVAKLPGLRAPIIRPTTVGANAKSMFIPKFYQQGAVKRLQVALDPGQATSALGYNPFVLIHIGPGFRL